MNLCPCGSNHAYEKCCQPIIQREVTAETAEQMMRARYTAHVVVNLDFIYETTHPDARSDYDFDGTRKWAEESEWLGLEIVNTKDGSVKDDTGEVEFTARFRTREGIRNHHERSSFKRCDGGWVFCQGDMVKSGPVTTSKVGRNDPCPCGSGKKFKKCCG